MSFSRINSLGWALFEELTSAQMNGLDIDHSNAIDGLNGGAYAPASAIAIAGAGLNATAKFNAPSLTIFNVKFYGAVGNGVTADQTAIDAAITAAAAVNGIVWFPPGTYLYTGLTIPQGVNIFAAPGVFLVNTGAGTSISFTQPNDGPASEIYNVRFHASAVNTATVFVNNADARVVFRNCAVNGYVSGGGYLTNLQGKIAFINSAGSRLDFERCDLVIGGTVIGLHATLGKIAMRRGSLTMPAVYANALAQSEPGAGITLDEVRVNLTAHTTGVAYVLYANTSAAADFTALRDCDIDATGATGTLTAFQWTPDANVVYRGNKLSPTGVAPFGANSAPSASSFVELREYIQQNFTTSAAIDLRPTYGYRTHLVRNDANVVDIKLPAGIADGQELCFIYVSDGLVTAGDLTFSTTKITANAVPTVGAGTTLTGHFRWVKKEASGDSDRWMQVGTWGNGVTLV